MMRQCLDDEPHEAIRIGSSGVRSVCAFCWLKTIMCWEKH